MKVAVISYDIRYIEGLKEKMKEVEILPYGDTVSFLKDSGINKPDLIVYDTTSGIFAEDDLRYLLSKGLTEDKKIYALTSPENPIDSSIFEGRVLFFDKHNQLNEVITSIISLKPHSEEIKEEQPSFQIEDLTDFQVEESHQEKDFTDLEHTLELEHDFFPSESNIKIEAPAQLEPTTLDFGFEQEAKKEEIVDIKFEEPVFDEPILELSEELSSLESLVEPQMDNHIEEISLEEISEKLPKPEESVEEKISVKELIKNNNVVSQEESKLNGGEKMVANFNIQISDEEVKKLALQMARDFLEKDPAMEKIIDHLQIDFQSEAMRELEEIKNELKEQLRREVEKKISIEVEKLIKGELKSYVAEITAKIVKEKIEQIFRTS